MNINIAMFIQTAILALLFTSISFIKAVNYKLEFVQLMYRHGDRAPKVLYPTDPNPPSSWPSGLGSLTQQGKKGHYQLGKLFRKMYNGFYSTKPTEVNAISTNVDRCLASAEANFATFFAPTPEWKFVEDIDWQPIPIFSIPKALDKYLGSTVCPSFQPSLEEILNSPRNKKFNAKHEKLYQYLTKYSGAKIVDYLSANGLFNIFYIEKKYNLTLPSWVVPVYDELRNVAAHSYTLLFSTDEILRLRAGPVLHLINDAFNSKMNNKVPELKFRTYSTHDINIATVLGALGNLGVEILNYCATLVFELYSGQKGQYFVRTLLLNTPNIDKSHQTPKVLTLPGCPEYCPYDKYFNITNKFANIDYEKECGLDSTQDDALSYALSVEH